MKINAICIGADSQPVVPDADKLALSVDRPVQHRHADDGIQGLGKSVSTAMNHE